MGQDQWNATGVANADGGIPIKVALYQGAVDNQAVAIKLAAIQGPIDSPVIGMKAALLRGPIERTIF